MCRLSVNLTRFNVECKKITILKLISVILNIYSIDCLFRGLKLLYINLVQKLLELFCPIHPP